MSRKLKIFISYSHADEAMKNELDKFLIGLKRSDKIEVWQDRQLIAGDVWDDSIKHELNTAHIVLLLISIDFLNSKYIWENELSTAMQRHASRQARVIPIILRDCDWSDMPFATLQALPAGAKAINSFADKDLVYTEIAKSIRQVVDFMQSQA